MTTTTTTKASTMTTTETWTLINRYDGMLEYVNKANFNLVLVADPSDMTWNLWLDNRIINAGMKCTGIVYKKNWLTKVLSDVHNLYTHTRTRN